MDDAREHAIVFYAHVLSLTTARRPLTTVAGTSIPMFHLTADGLPALPTPVPDLSERSATLVEAVRTRVAHTSTRTLTAALAGEIRGVRAGPGSTRSLAPGDGLDNACLSHFYFDPHLDEHLAPPTVEPAHAQFFGHIAGLVDRTARARQAVPSTNAVMELLGPYGTLVAAAVWHRHKRAGDTQLTLPTCLGWPVDTWPGARAGELRIITWPDDGTEPAEVAALRIPPRRLWHDWTPRLQHPGDLDGALETFDALVRDGMPDHEASRTAFVL